MTTSAARIGAEDLLEQAAQAVNLILRGATDDGLALYTKSLACDIDRLNAIPVGFHLHVLCDAGRDDVAHALRRLAVMRGLDVTLAAALKRGGPSALAEYRQSIVQGVANTPMINNYLKLLARQGESSALQPYLDLERLVERRALFAPEDDLLGELSAVLSTAQDAAHWKEHFQSVRKLYVINGLVQRSEPSIVHALGEIRRAVKAYVKGREADFRALLGWAPDRLDLNAWAQISMSEGYNIPHIHPRGRISGVFYVAGPEDIGEDGVPSGALQIGPPTRFADFPAWPRRSFPPTPGTLVLMPSYFTHWTVPLMRPGLRIAIAFDVFDADSRSIPA